MACKILQVSCTNLLVKYLLLFGKWSFSGILHHLAVSVIILARCCFVQICALVLQFKVTFFQSKEYLASNIILQNPYVRMAHSISIILARFQLYATQAIST